MSFNNYYQTELQNLRELAREFSKEHPAIAPMLSGQTSDPDVERLLEGVAFLTGLLRQKLDDEFPEIIHGLTDILFPHYLKPVPSVAIVTFKPKPSLQETLKIPDGISLASNPVDKTECLFRTCFELEVHPLRLTAALSEQKSDQMSEIRLSFELTAGQLDTWEITSLPFFLGGPYAQSADLFMLLTRYVRKITVRSNNGTPCELPPSMLHKTGFDKKNHLIPFPSQIHSGYRLLQEYFLLPQKYLFLELKGWEQWTTRGAGNRFEVIFELDPAPISVPKVSMSQFELFSTPVVNLFPHKAEPILLEHYQDKIRIRPERSGTGNFKVHSVQDVFGFSQGEVKKKQYKPLTMLSTQNTDTVLYQVSRSLSPVDNSPELLLSLSYPHGVTDFQQETLTIDITCTNGNLPEKLQLGDICKQTSDSPELLEFRNITTPTLPIEPMLEGNILWSFLSHLSLNLSSYSSHEDLKKLLRLYIFEGRDKARTSANIKRIDSIEKMEMQPSDRLVNGLLMRGQDIILSLKMDHFACIGDLILFGSILDLFFSEFSSINTFTRLHLKELITGERFVWPERLGDRTLL